MFGPLVVTLFTLFIFVPSSFGVDIPDVTTIYDVKTLCDFSQDSNRHVNQGYGDGPTDTCNTSISGRVYKRTNALGLELFLNDEKYKPESNETGLSCYVDSKCDWEFTGWTDSQSHSGIGIPIKHGATYPLINGFTVNFRRTVMDNSLNHEIMMVFTENNDTIRSKTNFYNLKLFSNGDNKRTAFWSKCFTQVEHSSWGNVEDRDGVLIYLNCYQNHYTGLIDYSTTLKFVDDGNMRVYKDGDTSPIMNFNTGYRMKFVNVYYLQKPSAMQVTTPSPHVKMSTENGSRMESPTFVSPTKKLCLALVLKCSSETKVNVLQISALDLHQVEHVLHNINNLKVGWQVIHANIDLSNTIAFPMKIVIKKISPVEIQIRKVSSCNCRGVEIVKLSNYDARNSSGLKERFPVYTATSEALPLIEKVEDSKEKRCVNGGVLTTSGCACPPGFTGSYCEVGCGRNKIGQDCAEKCSFRRRGCEGYLVCAPFTGCKCASGYHGYNCNTGCSDGFYGNDCAQVCGFCADGETCDKFSGECRSQSCSFGYQPPYCRQAYVYYSLPPTLSADSYTTVTVSFNLTEAVKGVGQPKLYQIQFKEKDTYDWIIYTIKSIPDDSKISFGQRSQIKETIDGLKVGTFYDVRVLLMDASFNKYDGNRVISSRVLTKCDIPDNFNYELQSSSNNTSLEFSWNSDLNHERWCSVELFEVTWREHEEWFTDITYQPKYIFTDIEPGVTIDFKVRANTTMGFAPYSDSITALTQLQGTGSIRDPKVVSSQSTTLDITWRPPLSMAHQALNYQVTFKCVAQVACAPGCEEVPEGQLTQEGTSVTLTALQPFTQYLVTVTPENGPQSKLYAGTAEAAPTKAPVLGEQKTTRSNTSITVFWEPVSVCSSFLRGYTYQLTKEAESMKLLASGFTKNTSVSFHNLTASTDYVVKVFINTVAGWSPDVFLAINVSTSSTVLDAVRNFTVYKTGRTILGLRWTDPKNLHGELKSFKVQYSFGKDVISESVLPTRCVVWPEYYCHTLENLKSNRKYNIMVSARNKEMPEDGAVASLTTMTKESAPLPPEDLKVTNRTSTSLNLQWKHPFLINGVLRSFVVTIEESERFDQDGCCQDYPLVEVQVKEEKMYYEVEISDLHPASTYYLSVSAKTVSMGPSQSSVVYTRPPHQAVSALPTRSSLTEVFEFITSDNIEWLPQANIIQVNSSDVFTPLIRTQILLAMMTNTETAQTHSINTGGIKDEQLLDLLQETLPGPFWFLAEYDKDGSTLQDSEWGQYKEGFFIDKEEYELVFAQISDYNGVYNVDLRHSIPFAYYSSEPNEMQSL